MATVLAPRRTPVAVPAGARPPLAPLALAASLLLALALRLPFLHAPLGIDEGGLGAIARQWGSGHGSLYGAYWLDRPPLLVALFRVAVLDGAVGVRLLGAAAALGLVAIAWALAGTLGGTRAAVPAALLTAALTGAFAVSAVFTPAELLAAVPAAGSVALLAVAQRRRDPRALVAAGALAVTALLVKQSFFDAGVAGAVFLLAARGWRARAAAAYGAGVALALAALAGFLAVVHVSASGLAYALFGFRLHALHTLATSSVSLQQRVSGLLGPAEGSGLVIAAPVALAGLVRLWGRNRALALTFAAWTVAAAAGVLGGGSYWPHYLIQLIAPVAVLAALAPGRAALAAIAATAALASGVTVAGAVRLHAHPRHHAETAVAAYLRRHARPGDTEYVLYARANLAFYSGLPTPYPYAWSLMDRAIPGATGRLDRLLASPRRPTWIVPWQRARQWGLDPHGTTRRLLHAHYRPVAKVAGHHIYLTTARSRA
jgi:hypothetical protein